MPKSEVLLYSRSKFNATAIYYLSLPFVKVKYTAWVEFLYSFCSTLIVLRPFILCFLDCYT